MRWTSATGRRHLISTSRGLRRGDERSLRSASRCVNTCVSHCASTTLPEICWRASAVLCPACAVPCMLYRILVHICTHLHIRTPPVQRSLTMLHEPRSLLHAYATPKHDENCFASASHARSLTRALPLPTCARHISTRTHCLALPIHLQFRTIAVILLVVWILAVMWIAIEKKIGRLEAGT